MIIFVLTAFYISMIYLQTKKMIKTKNYKEFILYLSMMMVSFIYFYLFINDMRILNPAIIIKKIARYSSWGILEYLKE